VPSNLLRLCPPLPPLPSGKQGALVEQMLDDAEQYRLCAARHKALVDVVEFRDSLIDKEPK